MRHDPAGNEIESAFRRAREFNAPLQARLDLFARECRRLDPDCAGAWERLSLRLAACRSGKGAPGPGELLPGFVLPDECGLYIGLEELLQRGPLAITFQAGHWCPYSRLSSIAYSGAQAVAAGLGGRIIAITPDRQPYAARLRHESHDRMRVLTDLHNGYALRLGIAVWVGIELQQLLSDQGTDLPLYQGNGAWLVPLPATFVVGGDGRIVASHVPTDFRKRMTVDDLLLSLSAKS